MKRILINATQNEEIRVALCKGNHLYDFDLENRTREQKKSNIYKGHVTRVEPSLEAVFVEYGSQRQGFLPIREISSEYLSGNPRDENIKKLIKEGDELIVQVEKEERGNKGAALSTYVSLAGRYLVLMPNNPRGGGISRQISGKLREDMKRMLSNLDLPKGMSVIIRTAGIGKTQEDLQHDLNHLLNIWQAIQEQNQKYPSPRLVHQEAGVVTRAVRDYLRDDIAEIWIDNENAYIEAAGFIDAVMPTQAEKLRKYTDYEPMFSRFNIEKQIETAYQREVRLPSGGSIVIDQTEALVSIDINSAKSTKGSDVAETAYHTNLEAADEVARQLRLRDMGGLIVIDFIDMNDNKHQKDVEKRLIDGTKYDRARVQFNDISKFGLMEMSRQRLRPSLEESTGYICPRCHGNGMIRDLRSLSLSIMRQIEQIALKERQGEVQAEVPTDIAAFLLNEKRDSLVYLEQDSGTRITILPHAHLESPNFKLHFNRDGFAPSSYERITDTAQEHSDLGYEVDWQTAEKERPEQQPTRQPRQTAADANNQQSNRTSSQATQPNAKQDNNQNAKDQTNTVSHSNEHRKHTNASSETAASARPQHNNAMQNTTAPNTQPVKAQAVSPVQPQAVAWLSNLFAQAPQAQTTHSVSSRDAAEAIEALVNTGAQSLGSFGQVDNNALSSAQDSSASQAGDNQDSNQRREQASASQNRQQPHRDSDNDKDNGDERKKRQPRKSRSAKPRQRRESREDNTQLDSSSADNHTSKNNQASTDQDKANNQTAIDSQRDDNKRPNERSANNQHSNRNSNQCNDSNRQDDTNSDDKARNKRKPHSQRSSRGTLERNETLTTSSTDSNTDKNANVAAKQNSQQTIADKSHSQAPTSASRNQNPNEVVLQVNEAQAKLKSPEVVRLSLDDSKPVQEAHKPVSGKADDTVANRSNDQVSDDKHNNAVVAKENSKHSTAVDNVASTNDNTNEQSAKVEKSEPSKSTDESSISAVTEEQSESTVSTTEQSNDTINKADTATEVKAEEVAISSTTVNTDKDNISKVSSDSHSTPTLTRDALFAERYITAAKFGQASNDPRVVRAQHQQQQAEMPVTATEQTATIAPAIRGTVGEFIQETLAKAQTRMADEGVINCFIAAIAERQQQAKPAVTQATANIEAADNSSLDFSNYGYQPLTADYLGRFNSMTQAVSQFAAEQGKTAVTPRTITQRASNDPRGQHPDFQQVELAMSSAANKQTAQDSQGDASITDNLQDEGGVGHQENTETVNIVDADSVINTDASVEVDETDAHEATATALTNAAQAEDISTESEQLLQADTQLKADTDDLNDVEAFNAFDGSTAEQALKEDSQAHKSKTTIASYKNMIENVAEQLLPQTGMFNLTTPKVPKARTRKPKTEHKKPTQAEKAEQDDSDSES